MADLKDLGIEALSDMSKDDALERLRQIRLSRQVPVKKPKKPKKPGTKKKATPKITPEQAKKLLKLLGEQ